MVPVCINAFTDDTVVLAVGTTAGELHPDGGAKCERDEWWNKNSGNQVQTTACTAAAGTR
jgi:hypothetical protein